MEYVIRDPEEDSGALERECIITTPLVDRELVYRDFIEPFVGHPSIAADFNELASSGLDEAVSLVRIARSSILSMLRGDRTTPVRASVVILRPAEDRSVLDTLTPEQQDLVARIGTRHAFAVEDLARIRAEEAARVERDRLEEEAAHEERMRVIAEESARLEAERIEQERAFAAQERARREAIADEVERRGGVYAADDFEVSADDFDEVYEIIGARIDARREAHIIELANEIERGELQIGEISEGDLEGVSHELSRRVAEREAQLAREAEETRAQHAALEQSHIEQLVQAVDGGVLLSDLPEEDAVIVRKRLAERAAAHPAEDDGTPEG